MLLLKSMDHMKAHIFFILILIHFVQTDIRSSPFNTIVTFGDSNTDTGNVYKLTNHQWPLVQPYDQGRFTNGPIWIDKLRISNIQNYAYADATIDNDNLMAGFTGPNQIPVPGVRQQIVTYLEDNEIGTVDLSRTLYIIWTSGNEYLLNSSLSPVIVVPSLLTTVYDLLILGIQHLIIMNLSPLQSFPGMKQNDRFSQLVIDHNNLLASNLTNIRSEYPIASIRLFDMYSLITTILSNHSIHIFNTINPCWNISNNSIIAQCSNPNEYVFIDNYHFTSAIHQIIADDIQQFISSSRLRSFPVWKLSLCICIFTLMVKKYQYR